MSNSDDVHLKDYLFEKYRQASWMIDSIHSRNDTLLKCTKEILKFQSAFLKSGTKSLKPLSLSDIAIRLDLHESTVSRAVKDKYFQCSLGTFPLSIFFVQAVNDNTGMVTSEIIKERIRTFIQDEDKSHPLSDQTICDLLKNEGVAISRRTTAKYREEMSIPGSVGRKNKK